MKRLGIIFLSFIISIGIIGCSSSKQDETGGKDKSFVSDVSKATKARWDYIDDISAGKITGQGEKDNNKQYVKKEMDIIAKYKDAEFDNPELGKLSKDYIAALEKQEEALKYYDNDYTKFDKLWSEGYDARSTILVTLVEKFGVQVSEKQFEGLKENAQIVKEENEVKTKIDEMLKNMKFEKVKDEYGWKYYESVVENTSGADFDSFYINVNLIDSDGVIVETTQAYHNGPWKKDQKVKFEFMTEKSFEKMEWNAEYYITQ